MQAVTCDVVLSSVRTRSDNSLGLSFCTPELSSDEMLVFLELKQKNLKMLLQPDGDNTDAGLKTVKGEFDKKSPSTRLRNVLFILWKQQEAVMDFNSWYLKRMEKIIDDHKDMLERRDT